MNFKDIIIAFFILSFFGIAVLFKLVNDAEIVYWANKLIKVEDSLAQWAMAFFALCATVLSALALYYLKQTLKATTETLQQARLTTLAAQKQADAATKQLRATERPKLKIRQEVVEKDENGLWYAQVLVENNGPAKAEIIRSDFIVQFDNKRPMLRPYDNQYGPPNNPFKHPTKPPTLITAMKGPVIRHIVTPSETIIWKQYLERKPILSKTVLLGRIIYTKPNDEHRYKLFFYRFFDINAERFVTFKPTEMDCEYERED